VAYLYDFEQIGYISSGMHLHLTVQAETSVPVATKSCCRSFTVTQWFFWTCLLRNQVADFDSFLFLPCCSGSVTTVPLTLNLQTMLPTVSLGTFSSFAISCSLFVKGDDIFS